MPQVQLVLVGRRVQQDPQVELDLLVLQVLLERRVQQEIQGFKDLKDLEV